MTSDVITQFTAKSWVQLRIEPVEVSLDGDDSLLFSTVQSVVPGAHGLYYRENGQRKALNFDTNTGRVFAPLGGWHNQDIFIHLAHGTRHGVHYADYTKASQQFEKNVSAVQKLIAAAGLSYGFKFSKDKGSRSRSRGVPKSGFEAQPENAHVSDEADSKLQGTDNNATNQLVEQKNKEIEKLTMDNHNLKIKVKDLRHELKDEKKSNNELIRALKGKKEDEKDRSKRSKLDSTTDSVAEEKLADNEKLLEQSLQTVNEKNDEISRQNLLIEQLRNELSEIKQQLEQRPTEQAEIVIPTSEEEVLQQSASVTEASPSAEDEHLAMIRGIQQEQLSIITAKDEQIDSINNELINLKHQLEDAQNREHEIREKNQDISNLHSVIADLRSQLSTIQREKHEHEQSLGEHKDLLRNAKEKVNFLENQVNVLNGGDPKERPSSQRPRSRPPSESEDPNKPQHVRNIEAKLQMASSALRNAESEKQKLQEANWYANERVAKLEKENGYLKGISEELRNSLKNASNSQLLSEKDERIRELLEQRSKLEWRIGELSQWWNDAKWKVGELEAGVAHQRYLLDTANGKIQSLHEQSPHHVPSTSGSSSSPFVQRPTPATNFAVQQNYNGQWQLANHPSSFSNFSVPSIPVIPSFQAFPQPYQMAQPFSAPVQDTRRVQLAVESDATEIFVMGSFLNWQCALRCDPQPESNRKSVVLDLPRGRHEFRFLINGSWTTSALFQTVPNGFGGENNVLWID